MENLAVAAGRIEVHLDRLGAVASARQRGEELIVLAVGAHSAALERVVSLSPDPRLIEDDAEVAEVLWAHRPSPPEPELLSDVSERIDTQLGAIEQTGVPGMSDAARGLLDAVAEIYGSALSRAIELLHDAGHHAAIRSVLDDELTSTALVVHGLHPDDVASRAQRAIQQVSAGFAASGPQVVLDGVDPDGTVRLRAVGEPVRDRWRVAVAAERAVKTAAPDAAEVVVTGADDPDTAPAGQVLIPLSSIGRKQPSTPGRWVEVPDLLRLAPGDVMQLAVEDVRLIACSVDGDLFVAVDPFSDAGLALREQANGPPVVESSTGAVFVFQNPLPVQRSDDLVEVALP